MKQTIYLLFLSFSLIISCTNSTEKVKDVDVAKEELYINLDSHQLLPSDSSFFEVDSGRVQFICKTNIPFGKTIIVNKGARLNTVSEEMLKKAVAHDTITINDTIFKVSFPATFTTNGYLSFELISDVGEAPFHKEFSIRYKTVKNENGIEIPEFPIHLIIEALSDKK